MSRGQVTVMKAVLSPTNSPTSPTGGVGGKFGGGGRGGVGGGGGVPGVSGVVAGKLPSPHDPSASYVHSRVTIYQSSKIDLRYCRSLHSCSACRLGRVDFPCGAIHYGHCQALQLVPSPSGKSSSSASSSTSTSKRHIAMATLPSSRSSSLSSSSSSSSMSSSRTTSSVERPSSIVFRRSVSLPVPGSGGTATLTSPMAATSPRSPNRTNVSFLRPAVSDGGGGSISSNNMGAGGGGGGVVRSRSLSILREGHELAPSIMGMGSPDRSPLMRLHPHPHPHPHSNSHPHRQQVIFQGPNGPSIRIGTRPRSEDFDLPSSPLPSSSAMRAHQQVMGVHQHHHHHQQQHGGGVGSTMGGGGGGMRGDSGVASAAQGRQGSAGGGAGGGGSGGVAITIQHGQTNITSGDGSTDIKIQGQGHEIHIQGSGGQNIRVQPAMRSGGGGQAGHVIRIQGSQPHASLHYSRQAPSVVSFGGTPSASSTSSSPTIASPGGGVVSVASPTQSMTSHLPYEREAVAMFGPISPPADFVDAPKSTSSSSAVSSPSASSSSAQSPTSGISGGFSFTSTKQIIPPSQKPTARVAPAQVVPAQPAPPPAVVAPQMPFLQPGVVGGGVSPASTSSPSQAPSTPTSCSSPTPSSQATPPFPVSPANLTPGSSPPPSPPPGLASPVAMVTPTPTTKTPPEVIQPSLSANHKDKDTISNHQLSSSNTTTPSTTNSTTTTTPHPDSLQKGFKPNQQHQHHNNANTIANNDNNLPHQQHQLENNQRNLKDKAASEGHSNRLQHQQQPQQQQQIANNATHKGQPATRDSRAPANSIEEVNARQPRKKGVNRALPIPQFYFPLGKPSPQVGQMEAALQAVGKLFGSFEGGKAYKQQMGDITKASGLPLYWKILLFRSAGGTSDGHITFNNLSTVLRKLYQTCHDEASRFMRLAAKQGSTVLELDDFDHLVQDVVETHPGLTFLQDAPEFHSRYVTTVSCRVMFCINRSWTGKITLSEIRRSNFLQTVALLETEEDINQIKDFFSYEHFYVIYCKFWELDKDHDLYIDKNDLSRHNDHALNSRLVDRIFSGAVTRGPDFREGRMTYGEFVWFLLAEEDKRHPTSIEYWFRCMDLDGDGVISMYEMEFFHEEQMNKMEALGIERLPFEDTVCQMMDLVRPRTEGQITLRDLKCCKMTNIFFDTFFNLDKFLEHEQRDPFANARDPNAEHVEVSDWNRFAEEEYDILVADEGNGDMDEGHYEDDFEPEDEDEMLREQMLRLTDSSQPPSKIGPGSSHTTDDIYDFSSSGNMGY